MDDELAWPSEEELRQVAALRERVDLSSCPEDVAHDINIARFLRGNNNDTELAAKKLAEMVEYRRNCPFADLAAVRETIGDAAQLDLSVLPHAAEVMPIIPMRYLDGTTRDGLPICAVIIRFLDSERLGALPVERLQLFMVGMLEQRSMVLHRLSVEQHRMAKVVDVRDLTDASVADLILRASGLMKQLKQVLAAVQDFYPEVMHKVVIVNAPATFAKLFSIVTSVLNERMKSKINVNGPATPFPAIAANFSAVALRSWFAQRPLAPEGGAAAADAAAGGTAAADPAAVTVPAGEMRLRALWLDSGAVGTWRVGVAAKDLKFTAYFVADTSPGGDAAAEEGGAAAGGVTNVGEGTVADGEARRGEYQAPAGAGCLVVALDNSYSWFSGKEATVSLEVK